MTILCLICIRLHDNARKTTITTLSDICQWQISVEIECQKIEEMLTRDGEQSDDGKFISQNNEIATIIQFNTVSTFICTIFCRHMSQSQQLTCCLFVIYFILFIYFFVSFLLFVSTTAASQRVAMADERWRHTHTHTISRFIRTDYRHNTPCFARKIFYVDAAAAAAADATATVVVVIVVVDFFSTEKSRLTQSLCYTTISFCSWLREGNFLNLICGWVATTFKTLVEPHFIRMIKTDIF